VQLQLDLQSIQVTTPRPYSASSPHSLLGHWLPLVHQVQRIKNEFTVQVYEIHARMALESVRSSFGIVLLSFIASFPIQCDMVEYNQCQATLRTLYELGIPGKVEEFTAYRILMLLHGRNRSGTLLCTTLQWLFY
jgi:hypothetical protein